MNFDTDFPMTTGSFMIFNQQRDLSDVTENFLRFFKNESCGFCTPCRIGTDVMHRTFQRCKQGKGTTQDLSMLQETANVMQYTSHCGLGRTAANPFLDFPLQDLKKRITNQNNPYFDLSEATDEATSLRQKNEG